jgi:hypothetical protein
LFFLLIAAFGLCGNCGNRTFSPWFLSSSLATWNSPQVNINQLSVKECPLAPLARHIFDLCHWIRAWLEGRSHRLGGFCNLLSIWIWTWNLEALRMIVQDGADLSMNIIF